MGVLEETLFHNLCLGLGLAFAPRIVLAPSIHKTLNSKAGCLGAASSFLSLAFDLEIGNWIAQVPT